MRRQSKRGSTAASLRERAFFGDAARGIGTGENGIDFDGSGCSNLPAAPRQRERFRFVRLGAPGNIFRTSTHHVRTPTLSMEYHHLLVQRRDGVMTIALNRPDVLNSFNGPMADELIAALRQAAEDPAVRAVLLTGSGRGFCAGQDLADVLPAAGEPAPDLGDVVAR